MLRALLLAVTIQAGAGAAEPHPPVPKPDPLQSTAQQPGLQQPAVPRAVEVVPETELDRQVRAVSAQLRCVVCQGLSIQDSPSSLAQQMRGVVREQLAVGRSPEEVKAYFVARYGEQILLQPEPEGFNLLVYVLPVLMLAGGALFVFFTARRWAARTAPTV